MVGSYCCASNCFNKFYENKAISYFRFPKEEKRCKVWVANMQLHQFSNLCAAELNKRFRLCSAHFEQSQFINCKRNCLTWNAIPTMIDTNVVGEESTFPLSDHSSQHYLPSKRRKIEYVNANNNCLDDTVSSISNCGVSEKSIVSVATQTFTPKMRKFNSNSLYKKYRALHSQYNYLLKAYTRLKCKQ